MKSFNLILFFIFLVDLSAGFSQRNESTLQTNSDSIRNMSLDEIKILFDNDYDFNTSLGFEYTHRFLQVQREMTLFQDFEANYGFHCDSTDTGKMYFILEHNKKPLTDPLWFLDDVCPERIIDILEFLTKARKNNPSEINETEFMEVIHNFYAQENSDNPQKNFKNVVDKTALMYTIEFGFVNSVDLLFRFDVDLELTDSKGKTVLIYSIENNQFELVQMLVQKGANTAVTCHEQKNILNYADELQDKTIYNYLTRSRKIRKQLKFSHRK